MVSRLLIPLLLTGALALACGPRSHGEASSPATAAHSGMSEDTGRARAAARAKRARHDGEIVPSLSVDTAGSAIRFTLAVENAGNKTIELHFPDGQTHDFVVLDSVGREVWRWAEGRMFTQAHKTQIIAGGDIYRIEESWKPQVPAGRYTAVATVRSTNFPIEERVEFIR